MKSPYTTQQLVTFYEAKKKSGKPDFLDVDGDGNKKESMKKALKDKPTSKSKKKKHQVKEGLQFFAVAKRILES